MKSERKTNLETETLVSRVIRISDFEPRLSEQTTKLLRYQIARNKGESEQNARNLKKLLSRRQNSQNAIYHARWMRGETFNYMLR